MLRKKCSSWSGYKRLSLNVTRSLPQSFSHPPFTYIKHVNILLLYNLSQYYSLYMYRREGANLFLFTCKWPKWICTYKDYRYFILILGIWIANAHISPTHIFANAQISKIAWPKSIGRAWLILTQMTNLHYWKHLDEVGLFLIPNVIPNSI